MWIHPSDITKPQAAGNQHILEDHPTDRFTGDFITPVIESVPIQDWVIPSVNGWNNYGYNHHLLSGMILQVWFITGFTTWSGSDHGNSRNSPLSTTHVFFSQASKNVLISLPKESMILDWFMSVPQPPNFGSTLHSSLRCMILFDVHHPKYAPFENLKTSQAATDTRMEAFRETWDDRREPVPGKSEVQNASETCKAWWFQRYIV